jgi:hypothetical protein
MAERAQRGSDRVDEAGRLKAEAKPPEARGLNVHGRELTQPNEGFGWLWRKTYQVRLNGKGVSAEEVVQNWKEHLPEFMPSSSRFYPTLHGIHAGQVVYIDAKMPPAVPVSTGVLVVESDDDHFALVTPQGHPESGYNTFSAFEDRGTVVAQIQSLARAADPLYEFGFRFLGGMKHQEKIWRQVLTSLAQHHGLKRPKIEMRRELLDRHVQWSRVGNIWHNALIRTSLHTPVQVVQKLTGKSQ